MYNLDQVLVLTGSGNVSTILDRILLKILDMPDSMLDDGASPLSFPSGLFPPCNSPIKDCNALAALCSSRMANAPTAVVTYINVSWPRLSASSTIWSAISLSSSSPSLEMTFCQEK